MPPKAKFSKDEIIEAALELIKADGLQCLTARALGSRLGSSARPIFTVFQSMEELQEEVIKAAKTLYNEYVDSGLCQEKSFKGVGTQYILFAVNEPKLFQLLFMSEQEQVPDLSGVLPLIEDNYDSILPAIQMDYSIDRVSAQKLYHHLWIYTHGIASLCATKMCRFTAGEINQMLFEVCNGLLINMKAGKIND